MILCIKADSPDVYLGIWDNRNEKTSRVWQAGRELSVQLLIEIKNQCDMNSIKMANFKGVIVYEGPGSYTGLRISFSTANAIGYSYNIPVIGATDDNWIIDGIIRLQKTNVYKPLSPIYGGEVYTTKPKK
jgi:tRNA threonylcarbamoyladenosine biosynthesis protein TsaB